MDMAMGELLSTRDVAVILNTSERNVRKLIDSGWIKAKRVGRTWVIDADDLDKVPRKRKPGPKPGKS